MLRDAILKAIDDEPELPGEMPEEMYYGLKMCFDASDKEALSEALRILVRLTKEGIRERVLPLLEAK